MYCTDILYIFTVWIYCKDVLYVYIVWIYSIDSTETPALSAENLSANGKKARV